jgi:serine/threonine protein phosphatase 1
MRWVIGDIHGMVKPLEALIRAIEHHDKDRQLMFVGDYVNRGPHSKEVIELLLTLKEAYFVRGNHDDVFDHVINRISFCAKAGEEPRVSSFQWFIQHGLDKTLNSYGITHSEIQRTLKKPSDATLDYLVEPIPAAHRKFIRNLPVVLETDDMFVAHAQWNIHTPTEDPPLTQRLQNSEIMRYTLIWGRYRADELEAEKPGWKRTGYFGHTPVDTYVDTDTLIPIAGPKIVLLDTAVALLPHGRLTAFCHEEGLFIQSDPAGKMVVAS